MLSPEYLLHVSEGAEDIAEKLHTDIVNRMVERIMYRLGRGDDYILTAQDKWQIQTLQDAGYLLEDIQKEIAKATKMQQTEIAEAMEEAGVKALEYDDRIYQSAGLSPVPLTQSPQLVRLMQRIYEATMGEWVNFTRTTANEAQRAYISALDNAYNLVSTGAMSYTQAVKEAVEHIVSSGVEVTYPTGHKDTIETATLRAVRTGVSQATAQIQIARMDEMGVDLVITSSHLGARASHQEWQGKIFSRRGNSKYPDFVQSTGYGSVSGLCGANCRHSFGPYFEGMDNPYEQFDSEENQAQYDLEQRQRTLERKIRNTKREVMGLKTSVDACKDDKTKFALDMEYQKKAALLKKQNEAYNHFCEENGLRPLRDRINTAKWDREQAAAARGAAKRYESTTDDVKRNMVWKKTVTDVSRESLMSVANDSYKLTSWLPKGENISPQEFKRLKEYAEGKGITLEGFKKSDVDVELSMEMIDITSDMLNMFPELKQSGRFTIRLKNMLNADIAETNPTLPGFIDLSRDAFRNKQKLIEVYDELLEQHFYPKGTDYRSVIYHEFGHLFEDAHPEFNISKMAMDAADTNNKYELQAYVGNTLSLYAAKFDDGREILSECFSAYFNSNENNGFVLKMMKKCGILK